MQDCCLFLLTPLREGRPGAEKNRRRGEADFYSRPCGRGDEGTMANNGAIAKFLLTPLREGRPMRCTPIAYLSPFLLTPLREGRHLIFPVFCQQIEISTHAPAGGATQYGFATT